MKISNEYYVWGLAIPMQRHLRECDVFNSPHLRTLGREQPWPRKQRADPETWTTRSSGCCERIPEVSAGLPLCLQCMLGTGHRIPCITAMGIWPDALVGRWGLQWTSDLKKSWAWAHCSVPSISFQGLAAWGVSHCGDGSGYSALAAKHQCALCPFTGFAFLANNSPKTTLTNSDPVTSKQLGS